MMDQEELHGRVLVIDDDLTINKVLSLILQEEFEVEAFYNAEDALTESELSKIDLIMTDVNLPGISGIDFLKKVQSIDAELPVIVITGMAHLDVAISALKNGAFDFIQKPFNNDQIILAAKRALEQRKLVMENKNLLRELTEKNAQLNTLNKQIQRRNQQIERDLEIASNLQECLFPISFPSVDEFDFFVKFKPVEKISGDFFDIVEDNEEYLVLVFADVSGHGVPAALYSAMVKTAISSLDTKNLSPSEALHVINHFLINAQKKMSYNYATICYVVFHKQDHHLTYSNAGIPAPILLRSDGTLDYLQQNGPFAGIFEDATYTDCVMDIRKGDKLILFTDGAYESYHERDSIKGYKKVEDAIKEMKGKSIEEIVLKIYDMAFNCSENNCNDDITIMGIYYK